MKQNLLRTGLMLLAMIVCAGIGRAQDVFDFSTLGYSNGTEMTEEKGANSTLSFSGEGASNKTVFNGGQVRWYQDNAITVTANAASSAVTSVAFEYASDKYTPSGEGKLTVSAGTYDYSSHTWQGNANSVTFTHPGGGQYRVNKITVTISGDLKTPTTVTFGEGVDGQIITVTEGKEGEFAAPKATLTPAEAGSVAYASDNAAVAAVDAATGAVTFGKEFGQATITASFAGNNTYAASEASYTIEYKKDMSAALFYESFDGNDGTGGNDGAWSGNAGSGTAVYDNEGWTAENIYRANKCVKLGTGSKVGAAETPALAGLNGDATLTFKAGAWDSSSEATTLNVTVSGGGQLSREAAGQPWEGLAVLQSREDYSIDLRVKTEGIASYTTDAAEPDSDPQGWTLQFLEEETPITLGEPVPVALLLYSGDGSLRTHPLTDFADPAAFDGEDLALVQAVTLTFTA